MNRWMVKNYVACHSLRPQLELNLFSLEHLTKIFLKIFSRLTHISVILRWFPAIIHNIIICLKRRKYLCKIHLAHICKDLIIFYGWLILCYLPSSLSDLSMTRLTNSSALSAVVHNVDHLKFGLVPVRCVVETGKKRIWRRTSWSVGCLSTHSMRCVTINRKAIYRETL